MRFILNTDNRKGLAAIFLGTILAGAVAPITKIGLSEIPPLSFVFFRFFLATLVILPFILKKISYKEIIQLIPLSLFASINIILFVLGIKTTTATIGQLLYGGVPLLTGVILFLLFKERLSFMKSIGIIVGFIGVAGVILLPVIEKGKPFSGDIVGNLLIGLAVISWSFYMVFSKKAQKTHSPLMITAVFIITTTIISFFLFILDIRSYSNLWQNIGSSGMISIIYVSIATVGSYMLNQYAIKHGGSVFASMGFYLVPIFTYFSSFLLLGEKLTAGLITGGVLVILGIYIFTKKSN